MADEEREDAPRPEEEEEEDEEAWAEPVNLEGLPAGNTTIFVGGFSPLATLAEGLALWKHIDDQIIVLKGTYDGDVSLDANSNRGLVLRGDRAAARGDIVFKGLLDVGAAANGKPPGLPADGEEGAADDADGDAPAKPAAPPRPLTVGHMTFLAGAVFSELSHCAVNDCEFGSRFVDDSAERAPRTVRVHGLSTAEFRDCVVYGMERSAIYCYPHARPNFANCQIFGATKRPPPPPENERRRRRQAPTAEAPPSVPQSWECEVGIHIDNAEASFTGCIVVNTGIGIAFNDKCAGTSVSQCSVSQIGTVGFLVGAGSAPAIRSNSAKLCGRECVVVGNRAHPTMRSNKFVGDARLKDGAVATGMSDNILGLNGQLIVEGERFTIKGFTTVAKDPTIEKPKPVEEEE